MTLTEKIDFVHSLYDFNGSGDITMDELTIMMRTLLTGLAKVDKVVEEPSLETIERWTAQAFRALKFQREEAARQRKLRSAAGDDGTASPGGGENPDAGGGLEGRLARIERILEDAGLGDDQDRWLSEG